MAETAPLGEKTSLENQKAQDVTNASEVKDEINTLSNSESNENHLNDENKQKSINEETPVKNEGKDDDKSSTIDNLKDGKSDNSREIDVLAKEDSENDNKSSGKGVDDSTKTYKGDGSQTAGKDIPKRNPDDPYAYIDRGDFTSEKFKIEIRGLPKFYGYGELKRFLNEKLKLSSHKVKPARKKSPWVFVCFKNEEDRQAAIKTLNRLTWKGKMLTASTAKPAPDPLVKKRKLENEAGNAEKKPRISDDERLKNSTTPYWNLPYDEQLKKKYEYVKGIMCNLADLITNVNPMLTLWIRRQKAKYNGMACNMLDIRKSPTCDGYRNKCEFTIGINEETKQRMVGFRLGSYVQGHVGVGPIDSLKHIPQRMKETVKTFEKFIRASSKEPFNPETHMGQWRLLTLRLTTLGELMVVVVVNSKGISQEDLASAKAEVKNFFEKGEGKNLKVNSLYFQAIGKRESGKEPPMEHLLGATHITESLLDLKFRISPEAFFQVNTPGAGVLYSSVGEMIDLSPTTTIVDVCCGTGTIGLSLAKKCGQVLGLEVVAPAIEDAKVNAAVNNITNCEFFTGRAEEILTSVLTRAKGKSVYAIVDPPRSGLQQRGVIALRGAGMVEKIIYVSCDPNAALKNFVDLSRQTSKTYHGYPLVPVCAVPVDMFPHTAHCEVIILFHRVNPINLPKSMPAQKDDIKLLSDTLLDSPSLPPNPELPGKKEESVEESNKDKNVSDSNGTKNRKRNLLPPQAVQQNKRFRRTSSSGGIGRGRGISHSGKGPVQKPYQRQLYQPKGNSSVLSKVEMYGKRRGQKRSLTQERRGKPVGQTLRERSPKTWTNDNRKRKWKQGESSGKNPGSLWNNDLPAHLMKDRRFPEEEYELAPVNSGRGNWKDLESNERGYESQALHTGRSGWREGTQERDNRRHELPRGQSGRNTWKDGVQKENSEREGRGYEQVHSARNSCKEGNLERDGRGYKPQGVHSGRGSWKEDVLEKEGRRCEIPSIHSGRNDWKEGEREGRGYDMPLPHLGRGNWKEGGTDRGERVFGDSSLLDSDWHNVGARRGRDMLPMEEGVRREKWERGVGDREEIEPKRWRDERIGIGDGPVKPDRHMLMRDSEHRAISRSSHDEGYVSFDRKMMDDRPKGNSFRLEENCMRKEPVWENSEVIRDLEDSGRMDFRRINSDRSPINKDPVISWDERRIIREEEGNKCLERLQDIRIERREVREEPFDRQWCSGKVSENIEDNDCPRMRRRLLDMEFNGPSIDAPEDDSRRSWEGIPRSDERGLSREVLEERRLRIKAEGIGIDFDRSKLIMMERLPRLMDQVDHITSHQEIHPIAAIGYRDKRNPASIPERSHISPDRMDRRVDLGRVFRKTESDNYRNYDDISTSRIEKTVALPYQSPTERINNYGDKYKCSTTSRNYDCMDEASESPSECSKMIVRKVEMLNRPIVTIDEYRLDEHRRSLPPSEVILPTNKSQMYSSNRFALNDEGVVKGVMSQEIPSLMKPWTLSGHPSVLAKPTSPVGKLDSGVDMYTQGRPLDSGSNAWMRERGREQMSEWRDQVKAPQGRSYFGREEPMHSDARAPNHNNSLFDQHQKRGSAMSPPSLLESTPIQTLNVEKSFSFSSARAAYRKNSYSTDVVHRSQTSEGTLYSRKYENELLNQNTLQNMLLSTKTPADSINKPYRQEAFAQDRSSLANPQIQNSRGSSIDYKHKNASSNQIHNTNFGQGLQSNVLNNNSTSVGCQWNNMGINPWEQRNNHW